MPDDKPRPNFSNVRSGESSTAPADPAPPSTSPPPAAAAPAATPSAAAPRTYTVVAGDNLSKIAKHFYGDANKWKRIFEANRDTIKNPDLIHPGQVLKIPDA
jgi:nucleoid-associated protein YgaU